MVLHVPQLEQQKRVGLRGAGNGCNGFILSMSIKNNDASCYAVSGILKEDGIGSWDLHHEKPTLKKKNKTVNK